MVADVFILLLLNEYLKFKYERERALITLIRL